MEPLPILRIWWIPQVPLRKGQKPFYESVSSPREARKILDTLANYDLYQLSRNIKPDYSNAGGLEVFDDGVWTDWYDDWGCGIDEYEIVDDELRWMWLVAGRLERIFLGGNISYD